jgi:hypothetical protein
MGASHVMFELLLQLLLISNHQLPAEETQHPSATVWVPREDGSYAVVPYCSADGSIIVPDDFVGNVGGGDPRMWEKPLETR